MFLSITVYITAVWPYLPASLEDAIILLSVANVHLFVRSDVARSVSRTVRSAPPVIQKLTKFRRVQLTPDYWSPSLPPRGPGFILSGFRQLRKALPVSSPSRTSLSVVRLRGIVLTVTPNKPADATRRPRPFCVDDRTSETNFHLHFMSSAGPILGANCHGFLFVLIILMLFRF